MTDMRILATNEIDLSNGQAHLVEDQLAVIQRIKIRLQAFLGDWFLNLQFGLPYFSSILVKNVNEGDIFQIYQDAIATTPGVVSVDELTLTLPTSQVRTLKVFARVTTTQSVESISFEDVIAVAAA